MSYDLFFYKRKETDLTPENISDYLTNNVKSSSGSESQWFVEDEETETYFSISYEAPTDEAEELIEDLDAFDNTHFTFNLNYIRADFFGQNAFAFVDKMIKDLDLFVYNPQANDAIDDKPSKPDQLSLYKNWANLNREYSLRYFYEYGLLYLPLDISNYIYNYRKNRRELWNELGDDYYVSKLYTFVTKSDSRIITLALLPLETAVVIPKADFYEVTTKRRKLFKKVEEIGLISYETAMKSFGYLFEDYNKFPDSKILHPNKVYEAQKHYNDTPLEYRLNDFAYRAQIEKVTNFKPNE